MMKKIVFLVLLFLVACSNAEQPVVKEEIVSEDFVEDSEIKSDEAVIEKTDEVVMPDKIDEPEVVESDVVVESENIVVPDFPEGENNNVEIQKVETVSSESGLGSSYKCSFVQDDTLVTFYVKDSYLRLDTKIGTHMIYTDDWVYYWEKDFGVQILNSDISKLPELGAEEMLSKEQAFELVSKHSSDCYADVVSDSVFLVPADIVFDNWSEVINE